MTREEIIEYCHTFPLAYEDYPFAKTATDKESTVMRHQENKKTFAIIMMHDDKLYLNLKCDPLEADFLRQSFKALVPGWHMNKEHWNSVILDEFCDVPVEEIKRMIGNSYDLIKPRLRKSRIK